MNDEQKQVIASELAVLHCKLSLIINPTRSRSESGEEYDRRYFQIYNDLL